MFDPVQNQAAPHQLFGAHSDEEVIALVLAGNIRLFEILMRRHNQRLYRAARAILRDEAEAEDVMQEAYVRAYEHLAEFRGLRSEGSDGARKGPPARFSTWLTRIAVNEALARLRKRRRSTPFDEAPELELEDTTMDDPQSAPPDPERNATNRELGHILERAVDELPPGFRVVFVMRAVEEMNVAETAECLGIPEDTVKTRLFRARALLRKAVLERLDEVAVEAFSFHAPRCDRIVQSVLDRIQARADRGA